LNIYNDYTNMTQHCISNMVISDLDHDHSLDRNEFQLFVHNQIKNILDRELTERTIRTATSPSNQQHQEQQKRQIQQIENNLQSSISLIFVSASCYICYEMTNIDKCCVGHNIARIPIDLLNDSYDNLRQSVENNGHDNKSHNANDANNTTYYASLLNGSTSIYNTTTNNKKQLSTELNDHGEHIRHEDNNFYDVMKNISFFVCPSINQEISAMIQIMQMNDPIPMQDDRINISK
jgi:hypothetical protein